MKIVFEGTVEEFERVFALSEVDEDYEEEEAFKPNYKMLSWEEYEDILRRRGRRF